MNCHPNKAPITTNTWKLEIVLVMIGGEAHKIQWLLQNYVHYQRVGQIQGARSMHHLG
jgi:hypothetical protein